MSHASLHSAIERRDVALVDQLLAASSTGDALVAERTADGKTPLYAAVVAVGSSSSASSSASSSTATSFSATNTEAGSANKSSDSALAIVQRLLAHRLAASFVNVPDGHGRTPLLVALEQRIDAAARLLLASDVVDVNCQGLVLVFVFGL